MLPDQERRGWECPHCTTMFSPDICACYLCSSSTPVATEVFLSLTGSSRARENEVSLTEYEDLIDETLINQLMREIFWERTYKSIERPIW